MNRILTVLLVCLSLSTLSQNPNFIKLDKTFGGSELDQLNSIQQTGDGGFLIGGITYSNDGDIIETGNHDSLMNQNGFYADLYNSQFVGNQEDVAV